MSPSDDPFNGHLSDFRHPRLTIVCTPCGRHGEYSVGSLRRKFGNPPLADVCRLVAMAGQCPKAMQYPGVDCTAHFARKYIANEVRSLGAALHAGWTLGLRCEGRHEGLKTKKPCIQAFSIDLESLVAGLGHEFPIERLQQKMCCPRCGSRHVSLYWSTPPRPRATERVPLRRAG